MSEKTNKGFQLNSNAPLGLLVQGSRKGQNHKKVNRNYENI